MTQRLRSNQVKRAIQKPCLAMILKIKLWPICFPMGLEV